MDEKLKRIVEREQVTQCIKIKLDAGSEVERISPYDASKDTGISRWDRQIDESCIDRWE